jgi:predicted small lipoprotein YifL
MVKLLLVFLTAFTLTGCGHNVRVYVPSKGITEVSQKLDRPAVPALREVTSEVDQIELVLIHGVADHCPGQPLCGIVVQDLQVPA